MSSPLSQNSPRTPNASSAHSLNESPLRGIRSQPATPERARLSPIFRDPPLLVLPAGEEVRAQINSARVSILHPRPENGRMVHPNLNAPLRAIHFRPSPHPEGSPPPGSPSRGEREDLSHAPRRQGER